MGEFYLNGSDASDFQSLPPLTRGYIEALFFTEEPRLRDPKGETGDDTNEEHAIESPSFDLLTPGSLAAIVETCDAFKRKAGRILALAARHGDESAESIMEQAGRDLWFTSQGHGVGFWDRDATTYGSETIRDKLDSICREHFRYDVAVYGEADGRIYLDNAKPEPVAYYFRCGDGNEGSFKRGLYYLDAGDDADKALLALVLNQYRPGSSARRYIAKHWESDHSEAVTGSVYEGPRGATAFGAAWLTAELEPAELDADGSDYQGHAPKPIRGELDKGARAVLGKPVYWGVWSNGAPSLYGYGPNVAKWYIEPHLAPDHARDIVTRLNAEEGERAYSLRSSVEG